jgi:hypothetical protein
MRNIIWISFLILVTACGGSMSEEQRKQMREAQKQRAIVKVTDAEITEAAFATGRLVLSGLPEEATPPQIDSAAVAYGVKINWLVPGAANALKIENQIIDAYINSVINGEPFQDNVQGIGTDSLLYTRAVVLTRDDGSVEVKGTWNIWLSKKQLILSMKKK